MKSRYRPGLKKNARHRHIKGMEQNTYTAETILGNQLLISLAIYARLIGVSPATIRSQIRRGTLGLTVIRPGGDGCKGYVRSADIRLLLEDAAA